VDEPLNIDHVKGMKLTNTKINGKSYNSDNVTAANKGQ